MSFNELCNKIEPDLATTLVGTWSYQCWDANTANADSPGTGTLTITSLTNLSLSATNSASEHCMYGLATVTVSGLGSDRIKTVGNRAAVVTWHHSLESSKQLLWDISG